ncbi:MAG TPA: DUF721 domain-containing protein [Acidimicrobiales bacterium]|nr:DUF721 domain-containing protein [Acidimicrobiales bacterium]
MSTWRPTGGPVEAGPGATPIAAALERVARRLGAPGLAELTRVRRAWPGAVGADIAAHTSPTGLVDGVLTVRVDDPAWATQLRFLAADLAVRIDAVVGPGTVSRIEVRHGRRKPR